MWIKGCLNRELVSKPCKPKEKEKRTVLISVIRPDTMATDTHGHALSYCTPVPGTDTCSGSHCECACLEVRYELPFTLDDPHDGLDHL